MTDDAKIKYPEIEVDLSGEDGNAFIIISRVRKALKRAGIATEEIEQFTSKAQSGDYDNVLTTVQEWVSVT